MSGLIVWAGGAGWPDAAAPTYARLFALVQELSARGGEQVRVIAEQADMIEGLRVEVAELRPGWAVGAESTELLDAAVCGGIGETGAEVVRRRSACQRSPESP